MAGRVVVGVLTAFLPLLAETALSARNERRLRALNASEPDDDVYKAMRIAYPGAFLMMAVEGWWRALPPDGWFAAGLLVWALSKSLKYAAIQALGGRWCFRVLVPPCAALVAGGPYRWMRHPNYIAVYGEFLAMAAMSPAPLTGLVAGAGFGVLVRRRITVEERALGLRT